MIESYCFSHKGGREIYCDNVYLAYGDFTVASIVYGKDDYDYSSELSSKIAKVFNSDLKGMNFDDISYRISKSVKRNDEYLLLRITDSEVECEFHGGVEAYIISDGMLRRLTNGVMAIGNEDRIICATKVFFSKVNSEAILADGLTSESAQEWMDYIVRRISDKDMLTKQNLTALTFIVRDTENVIIA